MHFNSELTKGTECHIWWIQWFSYLFL